jgi:predicted glycoside hydrolase/deacetylase ChbG (UPF0249 family)
MMIRRLDQGRDGAGEPAAGRFLIVNADDFGMSPAVNQGIIEAHEQGIVTSASLLVHWPGAEEAGDYARSHPRLGMGLHADLGEWSWDGAEWRAAYERVRADDPGAAAAELERQLEAFRRLVGRDPTHLDSHQHVHRQEPLRGVFLAVSRSLRVPLRACTPGVIYCGRFYGQTGIGEPLPDTIGVEALLGILENLGPGLTELGCHPGTPEEPGPGYRTERVIETQTLCDPRVRSALAERGITLCGFADRSVQA